MPAKSTITSSELGTLWMTYQQKTLTLHMLAYLIATAKDDDAKAIMENLYEKIKPYIHKIETIFQNENAVVPIGFTEVDVNKSAPALYENGMDILWLRLMKEISMGMHTLHLSMSTRDDIILLYQELTALTQEVYASCTQYLLKKGFLATPPYVSMPNSVEFVKSKSYMSGFNLIGDKRSLNTVEIAHLYHSIGSNITGMQLIISFAQTAKDPEIKKYFVKGKELAQSIITAFSSFFIESNLPIPVSSGGSMTTSTEPPYSDKFMMYVVSLLCSFSLGSNALGTAFSLRNDISAKVMISAKDVFEYAHEGAKLMVKNGWMEEPPQAEDRNKLSK
ncbi:DUF3231 family protein [Heyndrickxia acidicola]|uniref:DUF3231 family protein n=1 Tax=Heyndrickxia acidicola TaxID=209389 RepID=A0ABU6MLE3_9BACI|nr:DUF3231 family protein [Heyndrickxia acidicola]MED1205504.1 DUF3231 family protein [Heyndrickxia acidicola]